MILLGGRDAQYSLQLAKSRFRSISFADLSEEDFAHNTEDNKNVLFSKTKESHLGGCDAFISHSWSDSGSNRYEALRRWAAEFEAKQGRPPTVWLDKAINNTNSIQTK